jgi:hypothetical protein
MLQALQNSIHSSHRSQNAHYARVLAHLSSHSRLYLNFCHPLGPNVRTCRPRAQIFAAGVSPSSASLSLILWIRLAPGESIPGRLLYAFYTLPSSSSHTSHSNKHFLPCFLHSTRSSICLPHSNIFHLKSVSNIGPSFTLTFGQSSTHSHSPSVNISVNNQSTRPHHGRTSSSSSSSSSSLHSTTSLGPNINQHH